MKKKRSIGLQLPPPVYGVKLVFFIYRSDLGFLSLTKRSKPQAFGKHLSLQVFVLFTVPAMGRARQHKRKRLLPVNFKSDNSNHRLTISFRLSFQSDQKSIKKSDWHNHQILKRTRYLKKGKTN